jgi:hypothetical protein
MAFDKDSFTLPLWEMDIFKTAIILYDLMFCIQAVMLYESRAFGGLFALITSINMGG